jgi:hypothetical protein
MVLVVVVVRLGRRRADDFQSRAWDAPDAEA